MKPGMLVALAGSAILSASAAGAVHTFTPFNALVTDALNTTSLTPAPAGTYNYYKYTADWSAVSGGPWSSEALSGVWSVGDAQYLTSPNSPQFGAASSGAATQLRWGGTLAIPLAGGEALEFDAVQDFAGSSAQWDNITITIQTDPDGPLPAGVAIAGPSSTSLGTQGGVGAGFTIDTLASDFDTELGLYNQAGDLLATNDDEGSGPLQSLIDLTQGVYDGASHSILAGLSEGTYYIALGGYNSAFGATGFGATGGTATGNYDLALGGSSLASGTLGSGEIVWYSFDIVPAPGVTGLMALGGLVGLRRRR